MPKDTKKDAKKGFPLLTTAQSNAYKEIVGVLIISCRNKEKCCFLDPTFKWKN